MSRTVAATVIDVVVVVVVHFYVIYISYCFPFICIFLIISFGVLTLCFERQCSYACGRLVAVQCAHLTIVAHKHSLLLLLLVISFNGYSVIVEYFLSLPAQMWLDVFVCVRLLVLFHFGIFSECDIN